MYNVYCTCLYIVYLQSILAMNKQFEFQSILYYVRLIPCVRTTRLTLTILYISYTYYPKDLHILLKVCVI